MHKFWASIKKETLLLLRDPGGLAILFIMPLVLLIVITMVQDNTFKTISDTKIPILLVDNDKGFVSEGIIDSLGASGNFKVVLMENGEEARNLVGVGEYQLAIELPPNLSSGLEKKVGKNVQGILESFGLEEGSNDTAPTIVHEVVLYFDPASQPSFRNSVRNGIDKMIYQIESQSIYQAFQEQLSSVADAAPAFDTTGFITFREMAPGREGEAPIPNSSQHNVPAWTLFAIFFIIVPLSINLVKEKNQGTSVRLRTQPVRYRTILAGKTAVYVVVCLLQFALMLALGVYLFPSLGLPGLEVKG
ncbi:MAG: ABC transporter permease, partial [Flavobacteriaceae bacterium]